jgi:transcription initiation factor TFIID TATA-box-binding protein
VKEDIEISNLVVSGKLDSSTRFDLSKVAEALEACENIEDVEHSRRNGNRLLIKFKGEESTGIFAPTGVFVFTGVNTMDDIENSKRKLFESFKQIELISSMNPSLDDEFEIQNVVAVGDVDMNLDLNALSIGLGLENVEYEPEQFPGLVYRTSATILLFTSGKVVITGVRSKEDAAEAFDELESKLDEVMN